MKNLKDKILDAVIIVSSDCDYVPLVIKLKKLGKKVIGFGEKKTKEFAKNRILILLH